jgi:hypothetical protein
MKKVVISLLIMVIAVGAVTAQGIDMGGASALPGVDGFYAGAEFGVADFEAASESMHLIPYLGFGTELINNLDFYGKLALPVWIDAGDVDVNLAIGIAYNIEIGLGNLSFGVEAPMTLYSGYSKLLLTDVCLNFFAGLDADQFGGAITINNYIRANASSETYFFFSIDLSGFYKFTDNIIGGIVIGIPIEMDIKLAGLTITPEIVFGLNDNINLYGMLPIGGIASDGDISFGITVGGRYKF